MFYRARKYEFFRLATSLSSRTCMIAVKHFHAVHQQHYSVPSNFLLWESDLFWNEASHEGSSRAIGLRRISLCKVIHFEGLYLVNTTLYAFVMEYTAMIWEACCIRFNIVQAINTCQYKRLNGRQLTLNKFCKSDLLLYVSEKAADATSKRFFLILSCEPTHL